MEGHTRRRLPSSGLGNPMANLKEGDRVRWKVTSGDVMTMVAGQRGEVIGVAQGQDGPITSFKNLDLSTERPHTFVFVGEIPEDQYELIA